MPCQLTTDFTPSDCRDVGVGGLTGAVYFIDYDSWSRATITDAVSGNGSIEAITLNGTGDQAIKYDLFPNSMTPDTPFTKNDAGQSGFTHTVPMFISPSFRQLKNEWVGYGNFRRVVAIIVTNNDVDSVAMVYGRTTGLELSAYSELPADQSTGGGFTITLTTPTTTTLEVAPSDAFFNTDRATTIAALEALLTPVP